MENLYDMPLHKGVKIDDLTYVTRVPGGWIYSITNEGDDAHVFVPFNAEFFKDKSLQCEVYGHNMQEVYKLSNHRSSWGLNKCSVCGHEEDWQYDFG